MENKERKKILPDSLGNKVTPFILLGYTILLYVEVLFYGGGIDDYRACAERNAYLKD